MYVVVIPPQSPQTPPTKEELERMEQLRREIDAELNDEYLPPIKFKTKLIWLIVVLLIVISVITLGYNQ